jgi:hypothetical protein
MPQVTVGCKLPHGIIMTLGAGPTEKRVKVHGANHKSAIGGHGITEGVDEEFMTEWLKQFASIDPVKRGHIFVFPKKSDAAAFAEERKGEKTGFERLEQKNLPKGVQTMTKE